MRGLNILKQGTGNKDFDKALEIQQKELLQYELKENIRAKYESEMTKAYIQGFAEKNNMDYNSLYQNYKDRKVGDFLNDIDTVFGAEQLAKNSASQRQRATYDEEAEKNKPQESEEQKQLKSELERKKEIFNTAYKVKNGENSTLFDTMENDNKDNKLSSKEQMMRDIEDVIDSSIIPLSNGNILVVKDENFDYNELNEKLSENNGQLEKGDYKGYSVVDKASLETTLRNKDDYYSDKSDNNNIKNAEESLVFSKINSLFNGKLNKKYVDFIKNGEAGNDKAINYFKKLIDAKINNGRIVKGVGTLADLKVDEIGSLYNYDYAEAMKDGYYRDDYASYHQLLEDKALEIYNKNKEKENETIDYTISDEEKYAKKKADLDRIKETDEFKKFKQESALKYIKNKRIIENKDFKFTSEQIDKAKLERAQLDLHKNIYDVKRVNNYLNETQYVYIQKQGTGEKVRVLLRDIENTGLLDELGLPAKTIKKIEGKRGNIFAEAGTYTVNNDIYEEAKKISIQGDDGAALLSTRRTLYTRAIDLNDKIYLTKNNTVGGERFVLGVRNFFQKRHNFDLTGVTEVLDMFDAYKVSKQINDKVERGIEPSKAEKIFLENQVEANNFVVDDGFWYTGGTGFGNTLSFLVQMGIADGLVAGANAGLKKIGLNLGEKALKAQAKFYTKTAVGKGLQKAAETIAEKNLQLFGHNVLKGAWAVKGTKFLANTAIKDVLQSPLMASTYRDMYEQRMGHGFKIESADGSTYYAMTDAQLTELVKDKIPNEKAELDNFETWINTLEDGYEKDMYKDELDYRRKVLEDLISRVQDENGNPILNMDSTRAFLYGATNTFYESFSERLGGSVYKKLVTKALNGGFLLTKPLASMSADSRKFLTKMLTQGTEGYGKIDYINGLSGEWFEEIIRNGMYNPFAKDGEFMEQLKETTTANFHGQVLLTTLLLNGLVGGASYGSKRLFNNKKFKSEKERKEYNKQLAESLLKGISEGEFDNILRHTTNSNHDLEGTRLEIDRLKLTGKEEDLEKARRLELAYLHQQMNTIVATDNEVYFRDKMKEMLADAEQNQYSNNAEIRDRAKRILSTRENLEEAIAILDEVIDHSTKFSIDGSDSAISRLNHLKRIVNKNYRNKLVKDYNQKLQDHYNSDPSAGDINGTFRSELEEILKADTSLSEEDRNELLNGKYATLGGFMDAYLSSNITVSAINDELDNNFEVGVSEEMFKNDHMASAYLNAIHKLLNKGSNDNKIEDQSQETENKENKNRKIIRELLSIKNAEFFANQEKESLELERQFIEHKIAYYGSVEKNTNYLESKIKEAKSLQDVLEIKDWLASNQVDNGRKARKLLNSLDALEKDFREKEFVGLDAKEVILNNNRNKVLSGNISSSDDTFSKEELANIATRGNNGKSYRFIPINDDVSSTDKEERKRLESEKKQREKEFKKDQETKEEITKRRKELNDEYTKNVTELKGKLSKASYETIDIDNDLNDIKKEKASINKILKREQNNLRTAEVSLNKYRNKKNNNKEHLEGKVKKVKDLKESIEEKKKKLEVLENREKNNNKRKEKLKKESDKLENKLKKEKEKYDKVTSLIKNVEEELEERSIDRQNQDFFDKKSGFTFVLLGFESSDAGSYAGFNVYEYNDKKGNSHILRIPVEADQLEFIKTMLGIGTYNVYEFTHSKKTSKEDVEKTSKNLDEKIKKSKESGLNKDDVNNAFTEKSGLKWLNKDSNKNVRVGDNTYVSSMAYSDVNATLHKKDLSANRTELKDKLILFKDMIEKLLKVDNIDAFLLDYRGLLNDLSIFLTEYKNPTLEEIYVILRDSYLRNEGSDTEAQGVRGMLDTALTNSVQKINEDLEDIKKKEEEDNKKIEDAKKQGEGTEVATTPEGTVTPESQQSTPETQTPEQVPPQLPPVSENTPEGVNPEQPNNPQEPEGISPQTPEVEGQQIEQDSQETIELIKKYNITEDEINAYIEKQSYKTGDDISRAEAVASIANKKEVDAKQQQVEQQQEQTGSVLSEEEQLRADLAGKRKIFEEGLKDILDYAEDIMNDVANGKTVHTPENRDFMKMSIINYSFGKLEWMQEGIDAYNAIMDRYGMDDYYKMNNILDNAPKDNSNEPILKDVVADSIDSILSSNGYPVSTNGKVSNDERTQNILRNIWSMYLGKLASRKSRGLDYTFAEFVQDFFSKANNMSDDMKMAMIPSIYASITTYSYMLDSFPSYNKSSKQLLDEYVAFESDNGFVELFSRAVNAVAPTVVIEVPQSTATNRPEAQVVGVKDESPETSPNPIEPVVKIEVGELPLQEGEDILITNENEDLIETPSLEDNDSVVIRSLNGTNLDTFISDRNVPQNSVMRDAHTFADILEKVEKNDGNHYFILRQMPENTVLFTAKDSNEHVLFIKTRKNKDKYNKWEHSFSYKFPEGTQVTYQMLLDEFMKNERFKNLSKEGQNAYLNIFKRHFAPTELVYVNLTSENNKFTHLARVNDLNKFTKDDWGSKDFEKLDELRTSVLTRQRKTYVKVNLTNYTNQSINSLRDENGKVAHQNINDTIENITEDGDLSNNIVQLQLVTETKNGEKKKVVYVTSKYGKKTAEELGIILPPNYEKILDDGKTGKIKTALQLVVPIYVDGKKKYTLADAKMDFDGYRTTMIETIKKYIAAKLQVNYNGEFYDYIDAMPAFYMKQNKDNPSHTRIYFGELARKYIPKMTLEEANAFIEEFEKGDKAFFRNFLPLFNSIFTFDNSLLTTDGFYLNFGVQSDVSKRMQIVLTKTTHEKGSLEANQLITRIQQFFQFLEDENNINHIKTSEDLFKDNKEITYVDAQGNIKKDDYQTFLRKLTRTNVTAQTVEVNGKKKVVFNTRVIASFNDYQGSAEAKVFNENKPAPVTPKPQVSKPQEQTPQGQSSQPQQPQAPQQQTQQVTPVIPVSKPQQQGGNTTEIKNKGVTISSVFDSQDADILNSFDIDNGWNARYELSLEDDEEIKSRNQLHVTDVPLAVVDSMITFVTHNIMNNENLKDVLTNVEQRSLKQIETVIQRYEFLLANMDKVEANDRNLKIIEALKTRLGYLNLIKEQNSIFTKLLLSNLTFESNAAESLEKLAEQSKEDNRESWQKDVYDYDIFNSFSNELKTIFYGIPKQSVKLISVQNENGEKYLSTQSKNVIVDGLQSYYEPKFIFDVLLDVMSQSKSDINLVYAELQKRYDKNGNKMYLDIINKLKKLDVDKLNTLLFKMISFKQETLLLESRRIERRNEYDGGRYYEYRNTVINESNNHKFFRDKKFFYDKFNEKFGYKNVNGLSKKQKQELNGIIENIKSIYGKLKAAKEDGLDATVLLKELKENMDKLGFDFIEEATYDKMYLNDVVSGERSYTSLFGTGLIKAIAEFNVFSNYINGRVDNIERSISGYVATLLEYNVEINGDAIGGSFKSGNRDIQATAVPNMYNDENKAFSEIEKLQHMSENTYTKDSYMLQIFMLAQQGNKAAKKILKEYQTIRSHSLVLNKNNNKEGEGYNDSSLEDNLKNTFFFYMDANFIDLGDFTVQNEHGIFNVRMAHMPSLTISDKGRTILQNTPVIDLSKGGHLKLESDSTIEKDKPREILLSAELKGFLTQQIFMSELNRIMFEYQNGDKDTKIFYHLPMFNTIDVWGINIIDYLRDKKGELDESEIEHLFNLGKDIVEKYIKELSKQLLTIKKDENGDLVYSGLFVDENFITSSGYNRSIPINGEKNILKRFTEITDMEGTVRYSKIGEKLALAAVEFTINEMLSDIFAFQGYLGHPKHYASTKKILKNRTAENTNDNMFWVEQLSKNFSSNVHKRTAMLIAPGGKLANSEQKVGTNEKVEKQMFHISLKDVEKPSDYLDKIIRQVYGDTLTKEQIEALEGYNKDGKSFIGITKAIEEIKELRANRDEKSKSDIEAYEKQIKDHSKLFPAVKEYFNITATDAQMYTTWQSHLSFLKDKGVLTEEQANEYAKKIENNELDSSDFVKLSELSGLLQSTKPVYAGTVWNKNKKEYVPVYIKASVMVLYPQLTKGTDIDYLRRGMERLVKNKTKDLAEDTYIPQVYASYGSANKIGENDSPLSFSDFVDDNDENVDRKIDMSYRELPLSNFRLQQETKSKEHKYANKKKDASITIGSQIFKSLMANGINSIADPVFEGLYNESFLKSILGDTAYTKDKNGSKVLKTNFTGKELDKIYTGLYAKLSNMLMKKLMSQLGLKSIRNFYDIKNTKERGKILQNVHNILKRELSSGEYSENYKESIKLLRDLKKNAYATEVPLMFDVNRHKFESILQSIITNRIIRHTMPGNSHIVGSEQGFQFDKKAKVTSYNKLSSKDRTGIIWVNGTSDQRLKCTYTEIGEIQTSECLIKSHFKRINEKGEVEYVNLASDTYSEPIYDDNKVYVGRRIKTEMFDKELLDMFSFRIPTSSIQSGAMLVVKGFLPENSEDLIVVPEEHTIQLGEDYDVDKRYIYKQNYFISKDGKVKIMSTKNLKELKENNKPSWNEVHEILEDELSEELEEIKQDFTGKFLYSLKDSEKEYIISELYKRLVYVEGFQDLSDEEKTNRIMNSEIVKAIIEAGLNKADVEKNVKEFKNEITKLWYDFLRKDNGFSKKRAAVEKRLDEEYLAKIIENDLIQVYKSVYMSKSPEVQNKIIKPLVTNIAADTAEVISDKNNMDEYYTYFSYMSKYKMLNGGSSAKMGIGISSNSVVQNAQFQRVEGGVNVTLNGYRVNFYLDGQKSFDKFGLKKKTLSGNRDVADHLGENQNVNTDEIKLQIMAKRNENIFTMSAFQTLAKLGYDLTRKKIKLDNGNEMKLHIPSLLMTQPIIMDFARMMAKTNSIMHNKYENQENIIDELMSKYSVGGNVSTSSDYSNISGQSMYDMIGKDVLAMTTEEKQLQRDALKTFITIMDLGQELQKLHTTLNFGNDGIGISYFNTLAKVAQLDEIGDNYFKNKRNIENGYISDENVYEYHKIIGEVSETEPLNEKGKHISGFFRIGKYWWKPTTIEGHMLVNSLLVSNSFMPAFFNYEAPAIKKIVNTILTLNGQEYMIDSQSDSALKMKYQILSEFTRALQQSSGVYLGSNKEELNRLFDDYKQGSLASFIRKLMDMNHPLMRESFFKSIIIMPQENGKRGFRVKRDIGNLLSEKLKENDFYRLLQMNDIVKDKEGKPILFRGQEITIKQLMQDIATFAFLTNDKNTVFDFRSLIPQKYLKQIGVNRSLRHSFKKVSENSFEDYKLDNFIIQFFQNNPHLVTNRGAIKVNEDGSISVVRKNETALIGENSVVTEEVRVSYERLGSDVMKEYDFEDNDKKSVYYRKFDEERALLMRQQGIEDEDEIDNIEVEDKRKFDSKMLIAIKDSFRKINSLNELITRILKTDNDKGAIRYNNIIGFFSNFLPKDMRLEYGNIQNGSPAKFYKDRNVIRLSNTIFDEIYYRLESSGKDYTSNDFKMELQRIIAEELIHTVTIKELSKFVDANGEYLPSVDKNSIPSFVKHIKEIFDLAKRSNPYVENDYSTYGSKDIFEFIAAMYTNEKYIERLDNDSSRNGFIELVSKFLKSLVNFLFSKSSNTVRRKYKDVIHKAVVELATENIKNAKFKNETESIKFLKDNVENKGSFYNDVMSATYEQVTGNIGYFLSNSSLVQRAKTMDEGYEIEFEDEGTFNDDPIEMTNLQEYNGKSLKELAEAKNDKGGKVRVGNYVEVFKELMSTSKDFILDILDLEITEETRKSSNTFKKALVQFYDEEIANKSKMLGYIHNFVVNSKKLDSEKEINEENVLSLLGKNFIGIIELGKDC